MPETWNYNDNFRSNPKQSVFHSCKQNSGHPDIQGFELDAEGVEFKSKRITKSVQKPF